jgi:uncharacterized protein (PEP-CTERM system associated)
MTRRKPESRRLPLALPLALTVLATVTHAQSSDGEAGTQSAGSSIRPRVGVSLGWTDNLKLSAVDKDAAVIATVSPGISIVSNTGLVRGTLDYTLNGIAYLKSSEGSQLQQSLAANGQAEIVPRTFYVNAQASIGQQNLSAFGLQSAPTLDSQGSVSALANPNRSETGTLSVQPLLRGVLGGIASFDLSSSYTLTEARGSSLGDSRGSGSALRITSLAPGALVWYAAASTQQVRSGNTRSNRSSSLTGGVNYRPDPDWSFNFSAGQERSDYLGGSDAQTGFTGGASATWTPTPRTRMNADWQRHVYGNSHGVGLEHRMAHSVLSLSDTRNVTLGNTGASGGLRTIYDLYFMLYASIEPDPIKRDARVRADLLAQGLSPDAPLSVGFLSSGPSVLRNQMLSFVVQGVRVSLTGTISRSVTTRLGENLNQGDLANHARIDQRSYSLSGGYQLSPVSSLALIAARQETLGDATAPGAQLTTLSLNWTGRLGSRISLQLGARHSRFEGLTAYSENAAYATLTQQF